MKAINVIRDGAPRNEAAYFGLCTALHEVFRQIATLPNGNVKSELLTHYHYVKRIVFVVGYDYALNQEERDYIQPHFIRLANALGKAFG